MQQLYYGHKCHEGCTHKIITLNDDGIDEILKDFALALHKGELDGKQIHPGLYAETARKLTAAITNGMGEVSFSFDDPNNALKAKLLSNVHAFSGAKSLTENSVFSKLLLDDKGQLKPFNQFLNDIKSLNVLYNKDYLSAEYNNAVAGAQTAILWNQYSDDDWLEYRTAGDERVRASHAVLDGVIQQKNSAFWDTNWPPNGWNCRCTVIPADKPKHPLTKDEAVSLAKGAVIEPEFKFNSGQSGIVFDNDHPYFKSHKGIQELDAVKNYGLKTVESILKEDKLPSLLHADTETDYYAWWSDMVKKYGVNKTDFVLKDSTGTNILFDASPNGNAKTDYFKDHIIRKKEDARYEYAANLKDIVTKPDELWSTLDGWAYLKYYKDGLYTVIVENDNDVMKAKTMYKVKKEVYKKIRKGVLIK